MKRTRPPQGVHSIADLARREGINDKSARDRLRKYFGGTLSDLGISDWTYGPEDLDFVLSVIGSRGASIVSVVNRQSAAQSSSIPKVPAQQNAAATDVDPYSWRRKPRAQLTLPAASGVYALFLQENSVLPNLIPLKEGLIYIGLGRSLVQRCHFSGKTEGHSPRRSLAALMWQKLGLEPELGANGNYRLSKSSEQRLDAWMHENLLMAFDTFGDFKVVEDELIKRYAPPLNLTKCVQTQQHKAVKDLRKAMLEFAKANP
jgi:hypothetical protein